MCEEGNVNMITPLEHSRHGQKCGSRPHPQTLYMYHIHTDLHKDLLLLLVQQRTRDHDRGRGGRERALGRRVVAEERRGGRPGGREGRGGGEGGGGSGPVQLTVRARMYGGGQYERHQTV